VRLSSTPIRRPPEAVLRWAGDNAPPKSRPISSTG
jgi:hypothetical protein